MGRFKDAASVQDKLWVVVEADPAELAADGVIDVAITLDRLIYCGADPNSRREDGLTPLSRAVERGPRGHHLIKGMVSSESFIFESGTVLAVLTATVMADLEAAKMLLRKHTPSVSLDKFRENGQTAYQIAVEDGHYELAKLLLDHGADPSNVNDEDLLDFAIKNKKSMLVRAILGGSDFKLHLGVAILVIEALKREDIKFEYAIPDKHTEYFKGLLINYSNNVSKNANHPAYAMSQSNTKAAGGGVQRVPEQSGGFDNYVTGFLQRAVGVAGKTNKALGSNLLQQLMKKY